MDSDGSYQGIFNQTLSQINASTIIIGLTDGILAVDTNRLVTGQTTSNLPEGSNLYFTTARARGAFSAGTNITLAAGLISTTSNPTFSVGATIGTLNITNMTSNITNGISLGTSAGTAGNYNAYLGSQAGIAATGGKNIGIGYQALAGCTGINCIGLGFTAGYNMQTNGNVCIGTSTGQNLLTGSGYNVYIGSGVPSSSSASYEIVIGGSPTGVVGKGNSTCFISATSGLYVSNLTAGVLKSSTSGLITSNATTDDLTEGTTNLYFTNNRARAAITAATPIFAISGIISLGYNTSNLRLTGSNLDTIQDINTSSSPQFTGLTLGTLSGVLKATAGVIAASATTDDLTEGTTNLYFTNNRARAAITAAAPIFAISGIISLGYNTTNLRLTGSNLDTIQDITTQSSVQFARLLSSSLSTRNVFHGTNSGAAITSGVDCVAIGHNALTAITTAGTSTAVGSQALRFATSGSNTGVGFYVLRELTTGNQNTALGAFAGSLITTGSFNTLMGLSSGYNITSGSTNYCLGLNAGYSITSSSDNVAIGAYAMAKNLNSITITNGRNIAIGHYSSYSLEGTPANNISIGYNALYAATNATNNTIIGSISATSTTTAINNTVVGASCMNSNVTGSNNTIIGYNSGQSINGGVYNIHIGVGCQASAVNASSEVIIAGTSGTTVGKGSGTCFISSPYGLYSYIPGYWWGYAQYVVGGILRWNTFTNRAIILNPADSTQILCPTPGLYEFNLSGSIFSNLTSNQNVSMFVNGGGYLSAPCNYSGFIGWRAISLSAFVYVNNTTTFIQYSMTAGLETSVAFPTILTAKFCGL